MKKILIAVFIVFIYTLCMQCDDKILQVYAAEASYLTLEIINDAALAGLKPLDTDGTFVESSKIDFSVDTNHYSGYKLLISAEDDLGQLTSGDHSINSITSKLTETQFNNYDNAWGLKYNNTFLPSPTTIATELENITSAGTNDYSLSFGARINYETPTGTYFKNLTLSTIVNPTPYIINYHANTTSEVANMPTTQSGETTATHITLSGQKPTREGYVFAGWCTNATQEQDNNVICPNRRLLAGADFDISQVVINDIALYAIWLDESMQSFTMDNCRDYASDDPLSLRDIRDGKEYSVRYINGSCWMTQNLSFELTSGMTLVAETTNLKDENISTISLGDVGNLASGNAYAEARISVSASTGLTAEQNGYWYNYCAASAGQICQNSTTTEATIDICPSSWKIPSDAEWAIISGSNSWSKTYVDEFLPVASGRWQNGSAAGASGHGYWWSTKVSSGENIVVLDFSPTFGLYFGWGHNRSTGLSIRCVLAK